MNKELTDLLKTFINGPCKYYEPKEYVPGTVYDIQRKQMYGGPMFNEQSDWFKKMNIKQQEEYRDRIKLLKETGFFERGPFTYKEACSVKQALPENTLSFDFIPCEFYNKKIVINDYEVFVQFEKRIETPDEKLEKARRERSLYLKQGRKISPGDRYSNERCYYNEYEQCNVILRYHGAHLLLGKVERELSTEFTYAFPEYYDNWYNNKPTDEKPCYMTHQTDSLRFGNFRETLKDFFKLVKNDESVVITDETIDFQDWYEFNQKERKDTKSVLQLNYEEKDFEWFVKHQTKDGIYTPTKSMVELVYEEGYHWDTEKFKRKKPIKSILKDLGIHTIVMKDTVHFDANIFYDLKGIKIQAPKKVITRYGYEKLCSNEKTVQSIKEDREKAKKKAKLDKYNDTFDLVFHGKTILSGKSSAQIIEYLENKSTKDTEKEIKESYKPIFDKFPNIKKMNIVSFGTYYKYELSGERHYNESPNQDHIDLDTLKQINELYDDCIYTPDEDYLRIMYGWPERGHLMLVIQRKGNGLEITTEDVDVE